MFAKMEGSMKVALPRGRGMVKADMYSRISRRLRVVGSKAYTKSPSDEIHNRKVSRRFMS